MRIVNWIKKMFCVPIEIGIDFELSPRMDQNVKTLYFRNVGSPYLRHENLEETIDSKNGENKVIENLDISDSENSTNSSDLKLSSDEEEAMNPFEEIYIDDDFSNVDDLPSNMLLSEQEITRPIRSTCIFSNTNEKLFDETRISYNWSKNYGPRLSEIFNQYSLMEMREESDFKRSLKLCFND